MDSGNGISSAYFNGYYKLSSFLGNKLEEDLDAANTNTVPSREMYFKIFVYNPIDNVSVAALCTFELKMTYYCKFYKPSLVDLS